MAEGVIFERILLSATVTCETGLHIGTQQDSAEIGGMYSPVIRDPLTLEPYVPGSSLKGKLRSISERRAFVRKGLNPGFFNKKMSPGGSPDVRHHECDDRTCLPCRLFGTSTGSGVKANRPARLIVRDARMINAATFTGAGLELISEIKIENTLDRITSAASPRKIERVPRGAQFRMELIYRADEPAEVTEDLQELLTSLSALEDDYLGGNGSRGYGKVSFSGLTLERRPASYYAGQAQSVAVACGDGKTIEQARASMMAVIIGGAG